MQHSDDADFGKGILAGLIAGAAATGVMTLVQSRMQRWRDGDGGSSDEEQDSEASSEARAFDPSPQHESWGSAAQHSEGDATPQSERFRDARPSEGATATAKAAQRIARTVRGRELSPQARDRAATAVHWGFGTLAGAAFGALAEVLPSERAGMRTLQGLGWGTGIWGFGDELAVPALGLSKPPSHQAASTHLYGLVAHLVYGATLGCLTAFVRRLLGR